MRIDLTLAQINGLKLNYADQFEEDERGWLDCLEGETDAHELIRRLLDQIEREEGDRAALTEQMEARKARRDRCDARIKAQREAVMAIMQTAGLTKLPLAEATLSLRTTAPKLSVNDNAAVPEDFCTLKPVPNLEAIKAAFGPEDEALPNWLRVEPARPSLTIRRK